MKLLVKYKSGCVCTDCRSKKFTMPPKETIIPSILSILWDKQIWTSNLLNALIRGL